MLQKTGFDICLEKWREYIFPRLDKVCPREGMDMKADFFFRKKVSLSEIVGKKDRLSNRAERLSDRAKRGSDSVARLDSPSDWRSRKGKVLSRKYKFFQDCTFLSWYTQLSSRGTHFFALLEFVQP